VVSGSTTINVITTPGPTGSQRPRPWPRSRRRNPAGIEVFRPLVTLDLARLLAHRDTTEQQKARHIAQTTSPPPSAGLPGLAAHFETALADMA
jgi:hypothetical protein